MDHIYSNRIFQNILAWFILFIIISGVTINNPPFTGLIVVLLLAPPIYVNNLFILPFHKKRPKLFIVLFLTNSLIFTYLLFARNICFLVALIKKYNVMYF